ncbi:uncharacterized protein N7482_007278 [Penicillium canariense]|uniref:Uncharacterized protein n=1 Tax=Penicillium canariense TaxID=189055 RepID=A0A9W9HWH3_9EURO|nr:uncharacterized protein N7482_007278 [Penicillium canariense]KAJ5160274.1 hypothetical protein N7482_007278 [Penicillium canariense]
MRPGLDKPGALPLLALILFSLLTLVPSLSSIYNIKFADFNLFASGARQIPLIQDGVAQLPPDTPPNEPQKSWIMTAQYRTRGSRISRSSRPVTVAAIVPGEVTPVDNKSRQSYVAPEASSFMFGRRARAFRTYFIQQLDDYQLLTPFSNRSLRAAPTNLNPPLTPPNTSPLPTSVDENRSETIPSYNQSAPSYTPCKANSGLPLPSQCTKWQQACRSAIGLWEGSKRTPYISGVPLLINLGSQYLTSMFIPPNATAKQPSPLMDPPTGVQAATNASLGLLVQTPKSHTAPGDQTTDAAGHTAELRGSCMAVVIGLVAGIMWF